MIKIADWILAETDSQGDGSIIIGAPKPGYTDFASAIGEDARVWYSLITESGDREAGLGLYSIAANLLTRDEVHATLVDGVFTQGSSATPIAPLNLVGVTVVACTMNAEAYQQHQVFIDWLKAHPKPEVFGVTHIDPIVNGDDVWKGDFWLTPDTPSGVPLVLFFDASGLPAVMGPIGPKGDKGDQGDEGVPGETFKVTGIVATAPDLPPTPDLLTVMSTQDDTHLWVYDPTSNAASDGIDPAGAPLGWVDMGAIRGPKGDKGDTGEAFIPQIRSFATAADAINYAATIGANEQFLALLNDSGDVWVHVPAGNPRLSRLGNFRGPAGVGVPLGGPMHSVLRKASNADNDTEWAVPSAVIGDGSAPNHVPVWNPQTGTYEPKALELDDLSNVTTAKQKNGTVLAYDGADWRPTHPELRTLNDVNVDNRSGGDLLMYDTLSRSWVPGRTALKELIDVNTKKVVNGSILQYENGRWESTISNFATHTYVDNKINDLALGISHGIAVAEMLDDSAHANLHLHYIVGTNPAGAFVGHANEIAWHNGTNWQFAVPVVGEAHLVEDVSEIYSWNGTAWVKVGTSTTATLAGLSDVTLTTPADGESLRYDAATSKWINGAGGNGIERWTAKNFHQRDIVEHNNGLYIALHDTVAADEPGVVSPGNPLLQPSITVPITTYVGNIGYGQTVVPGQTNFEQIIDAPDAIHIGKCWMLHVDRADLPYIVPRGVFQGYRIEEEYNLVVAVSDEGLYGYTGWDIYELGSPGLPTLPFDFKVYLDPAAGSSNAAWLKIGGVYRDHLRNLADVSILDDYYNNAIDHQGQILTFDGSFWGPDNNKAIIPHEATGLPSNISKVKVGDLLILRGKQAPAFYIRNTNSWEHIQGPIIDGNLANLPDPNQYYNGTIFYANDIGAKFELINNKWTRVDGPHVIESNANNSATSMLLIDLTLGGKLHPAREYVHIKGSVHTTASTNLRIIAQRQGQWVDWAQFTVRRFIQYTNTNSPRVVTPGQMSITNAGACLHDINAKYSTGYVMLDIFLGIKGYGKLDWDTMGIHSDGSSYMATKGHASGTEAGTYKGSVNNVGIKVDNGGFETILQVMYK